MSNSILTTPKLYGVSSKGKLKEWTISVHSNVDGSATIVREHGYVGAKIQRIEKIITSGKNLGKANETTPYEQAVNEALSLRQKRLDVGFTTTKLNVDDFVAPELPMLAHKFVTRKHNIKYPCYVQPKLNGVRCLAKKIDENTIVFTSRKGKKYTTLDHLVPALLENMVVGEILDGEIYIHGKTFQHIVRLVKKLRPESATLQYHVYDMADQLMKFETRLLHLEHMLFDKCVGIKVVKTFIALNEEEVYKYHDQFVREGYEGVIIRNVYGLYKFDNRSADLQKYKEFVDEEFQIIGGRKSDGGLHDGCVIFKCVTNEVGVGKEHIFEVYPKGTLEDRRNMFDNLDKYIGKMLTVRYQELSEDGIPIFPIGIVVRDYE